MSIKRDSSYDEKGIIPRYTAYGECYPVETVFHLFDNYEDAKILANEKNVELQREIVYLSNKELPGIYKNLSEHFFEELSVCQMYEDVISEKTKNMNISNDEESYQLRLLSTKKKNM